LGTNLLLGLLFGAFGNFPVSNPHIRESEHISSPVGLEPKQFPDYEKVKCSKDDYKKIFFTNLLLKHRIQTYIEKENYDLIRSLLALIAPGTNISSYINLIVKEHLTKNRDVINELLKDVKIKSL